MRYIESLTSRPIVSSANQTWGRTRVKPESSNDLGQQRDILLRATEVYKANALAEDGYWSHRGPQFQFMYLGLYHLSLPVIPNELLDDIIGYLPKSDQFAIVQTCRILHDVGCRLMYRHVTTSYCKARRLFKTIAESREIYGDYVRSLKYVTIDNRDVYLTYILLCNAVSRMPMLISLSITARPQLSPLLLRFLSRRSIIIPDSYDPQESHEDSPAATLLPRLSELTVTGDMGILKLARYRSLTSISFINTISARELVHLTEIIKSNAGENLFLRKLTITIHRTLGIRISSALAYLASAFPRLEVLHIQSFEVNALEVSQMLTHEPPIFPSLRALIFNDWTVLSATFHGNKSEHLSLQKTHLKNACKNRQALETVVFGTIQWSRQCPAGSWVLSEGKKVPARSPDNSIFEPVEDIAIFWGDIMYSNPPPLRLINWELLS